MTRFWRRSGPSGTPPDPLHVAAERLAGCSTCGADPGRPCITRHGRAAWPPHQARLEAADEIAAAQSDVAEARFVRRPRAPSSEGPG
jgi:hypothetical protein